MKGWFEKLPEFPYRITGKASIRPAIIETVIWVVSCPDIFIFIRLKGLVLMQRQW
jgi:hypothetical protein